MKPLDISNKRRLALVLFGVLVLTGVISNTLTKMGYEMLATGIWILGYGQIVLVFWYVWIRPLDLSGPTGTTEVTDQDESE